ncbi:hypothetical protein ACQP1W_50160 [Spirillospora sp. CA-255316]
MKGRIVGYATGGALIALGLRGLLRDADVDFLGWAAWFGGAVVVHDAVLAPCVLLVGAATTRLPRSYRRHVQGALMVGGVVALVALPFVLGMGRRADNPSILPLSYGRNLAVVLAAILLLAGANALWQRYRRRSDGDG